MSIEAKKRQKGRRLKHVFDRLIERPWFIMKKNLRKSVKVLQVARFVWEPVASRSELHPKAARLSCALWNWGAHDWRGEFDGWLLTWIACTVPNSLRLHLRLQEGLTTHLSIGQPINCQIAWLFDHSIRRSASMSKIYTIRHFIL